MEVSDAESQHLPSKFIARIDLTSHYAQALDRGIGVVPPKLHAVLIAGAVELMLVSVCRGQVGHIRGTGAEWNRGNLVHACACDIPC